MTSNVVEGSPRKGIVIQSSPRKGIVESRKSNITESVSTQSSPRPSPSPSPETSPRDYYCSIVKGFICDNCSTQDGNPVILLEEYYYPRVNKTKNNILCDRHTVHKRLVSKLTKVKGRYHTPVVFRSCGGCLHASKEQTISIDELPETAETISGLILQFCFCCASIAKYDITLGPVNVRYKKLTLTWGKVSMNYIIQLEDFERTSYKSSSGVRVMGDNLVDGIGSNCIYTWEIPIIKMSQSERTYHMNYGLHVKDVNFYWLFSVVYRYFYELILRTPSLFSIWEMLWIPEELEQATEDFKNPIDYQTLSKYHLRIGIVEVLAAKLGK